MPRAVALEVVALAGALSSRIAASTFLKRAWLGVPVFSGVVVLPSIFFIAGPALVTVPLGPITLTITTTGLIAAAIFATWLAWRPVSTSSSPSGPSINTELPSG